MYLEKSRVKRVGGRCVSVFEGGGGWGGGGGGVGGKEEIKIGLYRLEDEVI